MNSVAAIGILLFGWYLLLFSERWERASISVLGLLTGYLGGRLVAVGYDLAQVLEVSFGSAVLLGGLSAVFPRIGAFAAGGALSAGLVYVAWLQGMKEENAVLTATVAFVIGGAAFLRVPWFLALIAGAWIGGKVITSGALLSEALQEGSLPDLFSLSPSLLALFAGSVVFQALSRRASRSPSAPNMDLFEAVLLALVLGTLMPGMFPRWIRPQLMPTQLILMAPVLFVIILGIDRLLYRFAKPFRILVKWLLLIPVFFGLHVPIQVFESWLMVHRGSLAALPEFILAAYQETFRMLSSGGVDILSFVACYGLTPAVLAGGAERRWEFYVRPVGNEILEASFQVPSAGGTDSPTFAPAVPASSGTEGESVRPGLPPLPIEDKQTAGVSGNVLGPDKVTLPDILRRKKTKSSVEKPEELELDLNPGPMGRRGTTDTEPPPPPLPPPGPPSPDGKP